MPRHQTRCLVAWAATISLLGCAAEDEMDGWETAPYPRGEAGGGDQGDGEDGAPAPGDGDEDHDQGQDDDDDDDDPSASGPADGGGDGDDAGDDDGAGDDGAGTGGPSGGDAGDDDPPPGDGDGGVDPSLMQCLDATTNACEECACNNCLTQVMDCQLDIGCVAIRICAQAHGCTGIDCLGPCGDVINDHGGPFGESVGLATALSDCYTGACPNC